VCTGSSAARIASRSQLMRGLNACGFSLIPRILCLWIEPLRFHGRIELAYRDEILKGFRIL
jgi:hypothetical protein